MPTTTTILKDTADTYIIDDDGILVLDVPANAVPANTDITVTNDTAPSEVATGYTVFKTWKITGPIPATTLNGSAGLEHPLVGQHSDDTKLRFFMKDAVKGPMPVHWMPLSANPTGGSTVDGAAGLLPPAGNSGTSYLCLVGIP